MQIAILHLSDIHIDNSRSPVLSRAALIAAAVHEVAPHASACVLIISGDVAYSGQAAQYEAALKFLEDLRDSLMAYPAIKTVEFVAVPGNHDCDFSNESDIREFLLRDVDALYGSEVQPGSDRVKSILGVQNNFFSFYASLTRSKELPFEERLSFGRLVTLDNYKIKFQCYNTAWLSRKHELQGKLFFPMQSFEPLPVDASISLSVFHHPYNWLDANNWRLLRDAVEQSSDIVFTGHEHQLGLSSVERLSGEHLQYVEGVALQGEGGTLDSGFNLVLLDIDTAEERVHTFRWNGEMYVSRDTKNWTALIKNPVRERHLFRVNQQYVDWLSDPGAAFHHKRVRQLRLPDFFVYPDFRKISIETIFGSKKPGTLFSKDALEYFRTNRLIVVSGAEDSGKTTLLRRLYLDLNDNLVPLLVTGSDLTGKVNEKRLEKLIGGKVQEQYDSAAVSRFRQLDPSRLLLLIDDFDQSNQTQANEYKLMTLLRDQFGSVIVTTSDTFRIRELTASSAVDDAMRDFAMLEIKELGHRLRAHLIHNWLSLGREAASDLSTLEFEVRATEKIITSLLGRNVVPSNAFNVLTLLHMMESAHPQSTFDGSYGALYEVLIKTSVALAAAEATSEIEPTFTYASLVAYRMYEQDRRRLSESDLRRIHMDYVERFQFSSDFQKMLGELVRAKVLDNANGAYAFKYPHIYYYFVAKYCERAIRRNDQHSAQLRDKLRWMSERLHNQEYANIVLFYVHLTEDWETTTYVIEAADQIFAREEVADCDSDVGFVNRIQKGESTLSLPDTNVERHQEEYRRQRDEAEQDDGDGALDLQRDAKYDDRLSDIHNVNIAFKTLDVLGQLLRSLAPTLEGDQKVRVTQCCYNLGLRTLRRILRTAEANIDALRIYFAAIIRERCALEPEQLRLSELAKRSDEAIIWFTHMCAYGTIKRMSFAIGHHQLADTYERVLSSHSGNTAVGLIDLQIKLEHFAKLPEFEISRIRDKVTRNPFGYSVLRQMIADYLYLYRTDIRTLQRFGAMFKIEGVTNATYLLTGDKRD
jgi:3',5'-cyclic AMP phosphodiesterase CpdA